MTDKFLKIRIPIDHYLSILTRAGEKGQRLGTYAREVLEHEVEALTVNEALARIEAALEKRPAAEASIAVVRPLLLDQETRKVLEEVRLISRELALASNAQILARVSAQLKTFKGGASDE